MVGSVRAQDIKQMVARQLQIKLPRELIMLDQAITDFGEFKVGGRGVKREEGTGMEVCVCAVEHSWGGSGAMT